jgi:uncharacterized membrane protein
MSKKIVIISMSVFYFLAGIYHFVNPIFYIEIVPSFISEKEFIVAVSGLVEIVLATFLLFKESRKITSIAIILMLFLFLFLVHFPMVLDFYDSGNSFLWLAIIRIPIQFALIFWAYKISKYKTESKFY